MLVLLRFPNPRTSAANTPSRMNLCSPTMTTIFFTIPADSNRVATRNLGPCRNSFEKNLLKGYSETDNTQYGMHHRVFGFTTAEDHVIRYCVPMDNQRPELDLRFFHDICPDRNGTSS